MRRFITGGIVLMGLVFLMTGGITLAANGPAATPGNAHNLVMPQQINSQPSQLQSSRPTAVPSSMVDDIRDIRGALAHTRSPSLAILFRRGMPASDCRGSGVEMASQAKGVTGETCI